MTAIVCHPLYSIFASSSEDSSIRIWDSETAQFERSLKGHTGIVTGLAFNPKGQLLVSASADMTAKIWDMNSFTCTKTLKGHDHSLAEVKFTLSGDHIITCSRDQTIKMWDSNTGFCVKTFSNGHSDWIKCISMSLDGLYMASSGLDQVIVQSASESA